jgi:hypothetical protein
VWSQKYLATLHVKPRCRLSAQNEYESKSIKQVEGLNLFAPQSFLSHPLSKRSPPFSETPGIATVVVCLWGIALEQNTDHATLVGVKRLTITIEQMKLQLKDWLRIQNILRLP